MIQIKCNNNMQTKGVLQNMVDIIHITGVMETTAFKKADTEQRIALIKAKYDECAKDISEINRKNCWGKALPLVEELVEMKYETTKLLYSRTYGNTSILNKQYLNMEPVKHNAEFIKQLVTILSLWGYATNLSFERTTLKHVYKDAINASVQKFYNEYPEEGEEPDGRLVKGEEIRFVTLMWGKSTDNRATSNAYTETKIIEALIY